MTGTRGSWTARLHLERASEASAERLARTLAPEASREVPRASSTVRRGGDASVEVVVRARDTGALRAALNTFLGWAQLASETERVAEGAAPPEALI